MELQKISKRFENLQDHLEKAYTKDIKEIIKNVFKKYDILYKNTSEPVLFDSFLNNFLFSVKEEIPICLGISQNGNKCCRKSQPYSNYCKIHFYLEFKNKNEKKNSLENTSTIEYINKEKQEVEIENVKDLEKIFIEDSSYYKDNQFVYNTTFEKVGYINNDNGNEKPVLTDDPFILGI
jgi:predicted transport protein